MMRAAVFSDSHGDVAAMEALYREMDRIDMIFFLGDMSADIDRFRQDLERAGDKTPVYHVRGNNDITSKEPDTLIVPMEERKALLTHGHLYRVRTGTEALCRAALSMGCDTALYGHTHSRYCSFDQGVFVLNPGAVSGSVPGMRKTAAILTVEGNRIRSEDVVLGF